MFSVSSLSLDSSRVNYEVKVKVSKILSQPQHSKRKEKGQNRRYIHNLSSLANKDTIQYNTVHQHR